MVEKIRHVKWEQCLVGEDMLYNVTKESITDKVT